MAAIRPSSPSCRVPLTRPFRSSRTSRPKLNQAQASQQPAAIGDDGFQFADALIGAGAALVVIAVVLAASGAIGTRRRRYQGAPHGAAQQGV